MPGITRQRYDQIQEAAMRLVASIGVTTLDAMTEDEIEQYFIDQYMSR